MAKLLAERSPDQFGNDMILIAMPMRHARVLRTFIANSKYESEPKAVDELRQALDSVRVCYENKCINSGPISWTTDAKQIFGD